MSHTLTWKCQLSLTIYTNQDKGKSAKVFVRLYCFFELWSCSVAINEILVKSLFLNVFSTNISACHVRSPLAACRPLCGKERSSQTPTKRDIDLRHIWSGLLPTGGTSIMPGSSGPRGVFSLLDGPAPSIHPTPVSCSSRCHCRCVNCPNRERNIGIESTRIGADWNPGMRVLRSTRHVCLDSEVFLFGNDSERDMFRLGSQSPQILRWRLLAETKET